METAGDFMPAAVRAYAGRVTDADSHESIPSQYWVEEFGALTQPLVDWLKGRNFNSSAVVDADDLEITAETVWTVKGPRAPGAIDFARRLAVLDHMGIDRQIIFPGGVGGFGSILLGHADDRAFMPDIEGDRRAYAKRLMDAYNDWCVRMTRLSDRLRFSAILHAETPDALLAEAKRLVSKGVRLIQLRSASLPGGKSPAHPALDPFWSYLADAGVPLVLHLGGETDFLKNYEWRNAPYFDGYKQGEEVRLDPWTTSTFHLGCQNFTATMVLGGVFERHPKLALGCIEVGAAWLGPLGQHLDVWYENRMGFGYGRDTAYLREKPSDYLKKNVRVSAFHFEPVDVYIEQFGLDDCYCFSSDWPHPEGGRDPMGAMAARLSRLGPQILEKFFVRNGQLLMPT